MTSLPEPPNPPGERRRTLDRPPGERYAPAPSADRPASRLDPILAPLAVVIGGALAFVILGGVLAVTAGLAILAAILGLAIGRLVSPPPAAALVGLVAVVIGLAGIWLFGRIEGGVLDPIAYFGEVHGPALVALELLGGAGLAAAASR